MFFDKLITSGNKKNNKDERSKWVSRPLRGSENGLSMVALHNGTVWGTQSISYWPFLYINIVANPSSRKTIQDIKKQSVWKKKRGTKEILHWRTHNPSRRIFRRWPFFYGSIWTILSRQLSFVWLRVSSIKRGTRRIIPLDELSFAIHFERRSKRSRSFA